MKIAVQPVGLQFVRPVTLTTGSATPSVGPVKEVKGKGIADVLVAGTVIPGVYKGGTYLIDLANATTPQDLAGVLQSHHLVTNPDAALEQSRSILAHIQSKGGNALLIGGVAGALAATIVDIVKPDAPLSVKLGIGLVVCALVAGLLYWGLNDKPSDAKQAPRSERSGKP